VNTLIGIVGVSSALAAPALEFGVLSATMFLLAIRIWSDVNRDVLSRRVSLILTLSILVLSSIFIYLVYARFTSLA